ncbi:unnamed protein product [Amoebophrya sp. A25]|nr:unnamed protein product [Amoebophrya sp. A25]|eukprot:GSA25T00016859001.1
MFKTLENEAIACVSTFDKLYEIPSIQNQGQPIQHYICNFYTRNLMPLRTSRQLGDT